MRNAWLEIVLGLAVMGAMWACIDAGWIWGRRERERLGDQAVAGLASMETAVFGLVGLLLAFSFSAGESRLEWRRQLIIAEGNALSTAYMRLELLSQRDRETARRLMREYARARVEVYAQPQDRGATMEAVLRAKALAPGLFSAVAQACPRSPVAAACQLTIPAVNEALDLGASRVEAAQSRAPWVILLLLLALVPVAGVFAGHAMAARERRSPVHVLLYTGITTLTLLVIFDLDNPRDGLIRLDTAQRRFMGEVLSGMEPGRGGLP